MEHYLTRVKASRALLNQTCAAELRGEHVQRARRAPDPGSYIIAYIGARCAGLHNNNIIQALEVYTYYTASLRARLNCTVWTMVTRAMLSFGKLKLDQTRARSELLQLPARSTKSPIRPRKQIQRASDMTHVTTGPDTRAMSYLTDTRAQSLKAYIFVLQYSIQNQEKTRTFKD